MASARDRLEWRGDEGFNEHLDHVVFILAGYHDKHMAADSLGELFPTATIRRVLGGETDRTIAVLVKVAPDLRRSVNDVVHPLDGAQGVLQTNSSVGCLLATAPDASRDQMLAWMFLGLRGSGAELHKTLRECASRLSELGLRVLDVARMLTPELEVMICVGLDDLDQAQAGLEACENSGMTVKRIYW